MCFPDELVETEQLGDVPDNVRVHLSYRDHAVLEGVLGGAPVRVELVVPSHDANASGTLGRAALEVCWHVGDSSTVHSGPAALSGPTGHPGRSVVLAGTLGVEHVRLSGTFLLEPAGSFDRSDITGELGDDAFEVTVQRVEGGLDSTSTVAAHGTLGEINLEGP